MNRKLFKKFLTAALAVILLVSAVPNAAAADISRVSFSGLSEIKLDESRECVVTDAEGNEVTVGIRRVAAPEGRAQYASGETWQVWYRWLTVYAEFYMTVSNNKVTSVYDEYISVTGGSYSDSKLTKTSTYGKLTFALTSIGGITSNTCWLKGTVTGENDQIDVTWQM